MSIRTLKPRVNTIKNGLHISTTKDNRITGRRLQARRFDIWQKKPYCNACGKLVSYPDGFELDHIIPLMHGGEDTPENCQLLCSGEDGCHAKKTRKDLQSGATKI